MKKKKKKSTLAVRDYPESEKEEKTNLSFPHKESEKIIIQLNNEIKKNLWGIEQDRLKIRKLIELATEKLKKIYELKKIEEKISSSPLQGKEAEVFSTYFNYIEQEQEKFRKVYDLLAAKVNEEMLFPPEEKEKTEVGTVPGKAEGIHKKPRPTPKILVIEDEAIIIKSVSYFLISDGYDVDFAMNAKEGLKKAGEEKPDLIILDIIMPGMNGYQVLTQLKKDKRLSHIPVIVLSALSREADILEGLEKGADDYITKPFSPEIIVSKVKKFLSEEN
ncbi:response regulator [bacterium]|nr:response regulator [bacterium]